VDEEFDFEQMAAEWFEGIDERRNNLFSDTDIDEEDNIDAPIHDTKTAQPEMEEWLRQSKVPLYEGSKISVLACVLVLMNLAHLHNVSNAFMDELLFFFRVDVLPPSNGLPKNRQQARRFIDHLGLTFNTIHACQNGCVLF